MPTQDEILAELQRRHEAGEFNDRQQAAFQELQRRDVLPSPQPTARQARIPDYLQDVLQKSGLPEEDVGRLTRTGITPGTAPEFAAAHIQELRSRGQEPTVDEQVAIQDMYRQQAGQQARTAGRDFFAETQARKREQKLDTPVGAATNLGQIIGTGFGQNVADVVGVVSPETRNEIVRDMEATYNVNRQSAAQNLVGGLVSEGATAAGALATGPMGMAAIYGSRGVGATRGDIARRRQQGQDIGGWQEFKAAAGTGAAEAASGFIGAKLFGGIGRALKQAGTSAATRTGIRSIIGRGVQTAGLSGLEGLEEAATEGAVNWIQQGYDPERAITQGVYEAFVMGGALAPVLGQVSASQMTSTTTRPQQPRAEGVGTLTTAEATAQAEQTMPESPATRQLPSPVQVARQRLVEAEQEVESLGQPREPGPPGAPIRVSPEGEARRAIPTEPPPQPGLDARGNRLTPPEGMNEVQFRRWYKREFPNAPLTEIVDQWADYPGKKTPTPQPGEQLQKTQAEQPTPGTPAQLSPDEVVGHIVQTSPQEDPGSAQEVEAERAYFAGTLENLQHGNETFVRVDLPIDQAATINRPDPAAVAQYASQETEAPPVVAGKIAGSTAEGVTIIDGKHRAAAALARGEDTLPAYIPESDAKALGLRPAVEAAESTPQPEPRLEPQQPEPEQARTVFATLRQRRAELRQAEQEAEAKKAEAAPEPESAILPDNPQERKSFLGRLRRGSDEAAKAPPLEGTEHQRKVPRSVEDWITPLTSRIRDISPRIFDRVMRMEFESSTRRERLKRELHNPAARITSDLGGKRSSRMRKFKKAVLEGRYEDARGMLSAEIHGDLDTFYTAFRNLFDNARDAGVTIGDLGKTYWPRQIKDYQSFKAVFGEDTGVFEEAWDLARAVKKRRLLTKNEKVEIANSVIQGYGPRKPGSMGVANARKRTVGEISDEALDYYLDPFEVAFRYVDGMSYAAERSRFLGRNAQSPERIEESIGTVIQQEVDEGNLSKDSQAELHDLLTTRFTADLMQTSKWVRNFKQLVYLTTLGQFRSTLTQLTDTALTAAKHGPAAAIKGARAGLRLTSSDERIIMEELGIHDYGEEFKDVGQVARATDWTLRRTGFKAVDRFGKETRINAAWSVLEKAAAKPNSKEAKRLRRDYESVLGEEQFEQVMRDLREGKKTENLKYMLFLDIAGIQPVVTSQMPKKYLDMPNGRIFYSLRTFTVMQLDFVRRDMVRKIRTKGQRKEGLQNLARYITFFGLTDMGVEVLKDLIRGRLPDPEDLPERAVDSLLALVGLHRYTVEKAWSNPSEAATEYLAPPLSWIGAPLRDLTNDTAGLRSIRRIPIVGELLYYHAPFGRGFHLTKEEAKRDYRAKLRELRTETENAYRDGDMDLVRKLLAIYNERRQQGPGDGRKTPLGVSDLQRRTTTKENPE